MADQLEMLTIDAAAPNSEKLNLGYWNIPRVALKGLGAIFEEGIPKYGRYNYLKPYGAPKRATDDSFEIERWEHALDHLLRWRDGDLSEDHLSKVMWFCASTKERQQAKQAAEADSVKGLIKARELAKDLINQQADPDRNLNTSGLARILVPGPIFDRT